MANAPGGVAEASSLRAGRQPTVVVLPKRGVPTGCGAHPNSDRPDPFALNEGNHNPDEARSCVLRPHDDNPGSWMLGSGTVATLVVNVAVDTIVTNRGVPWMRSG